MRKRLLLQREMFITMFYTINSSPLLVTIMLWLFWVITNSVQCLSRPNLIELLSTKICLAWNYFLDKNRITNQTSIWCILLVTSIQLLFAYPENHMEIWLEILFLWRQKFHAKLIVVLSSSVKLGPGYITNLTLSLCRFSNSPIAGGREVNALSWTYKNKQLKRLIQTV